MFEINLPERQKWVRNRRGLPQITALMMSALIKLKAAKDVDEPWTDLQGVDGRTIRALLNRQWIFFDKAKVYDPYRITDPGIQAMKVYGSKRYNYDGICPRCNLRPRRTRSTGGFGPYCAECESQIGKRKRRLGIQHRNPDAICYQCKERSVYISPNGKIGSLCRECKNAENRARHKRERETLLARVQAGEHIPCRRPGCDQPRFIAAKSIQEYCRKHYYENQASNRDKRRPNSGAALRRGKSISVTEVFERYPTIATVEHLPFTMKAGQKILLWSQVHDFFSLNIPRDLTTCECGSKKHVVIEMVCPEGYAIYRCGKCQRCFRIVMEYDYFFQEVVSEAI